MSVTELVDDQGQVLYWDVQRHEWLTADECAELSRFDLYEDSDNE